MFKLAGGVRLLNYLCVRCVRKMTKDDSIRPNHSSLTRLCVGKDEDRPMRHLAWVGSVCALFLAVGLVGFGLSPLQTSAPKVREQIVPVVFIAPEQPSAPKISSAVIPTINPKTSAPVPHVASVAGVTGPAIMTVPMEVATKLPADPLSQLDAAVEHVFTRLNPATGTNYMPQPAYPEIAQRHGYQGKVVVNFTVAASGEVVEAEVGRGSGFKMLDDAAVEVIRNRWRFGPGEVRYHFVDIIFQLK